MAWRLPRRQRRVGHGRTGRQRPDRVPGSRTRAPLRARAAHPGERRRGPSSRAGRSPA